MRFGKKMSYNTYIISNKPDLVSPIIKNLKPEPCAHFDGTGYESFSKLVNSCVANCPTETVIIMSDKVMPDPSHVRKVLELLDQGYGLVALYRFAFFGFKKELFRQIGVMDQHFLGGGGEDDDFYIRLKEANIACYVTEEVPYFPAPTSWSGYTFGKHQLMRKWGPYKKVSFIKRQYTESLWGYNFGPATGFKFLPYSESVIDTKYVKHWAKKTILGINDPILTEGV
jgi:hypothetical protein